jgi:hypothetical protein
MYFGFGFHNQKFFFKKKLINAREIMFLCI